MIVLQIIYGDGRMKKKALIGLLLLFSSAGWSQESGTENAGFIEIVKAGDKVQYHTPIWSPDGRKIIFCSSFQAGYEIRGEIYSINTDGTGKLLLSGTSGRRDSNPKFSPDGQTILFKQMFINGKDDQGRFVSCEIVCPSYVYLMSREGIKTGEILSPWMIYFYSWAPSGEHILFTEGYKETEGSGVPRLSLRLTPLTPYSFLRYSISSSTEDGLRICIFGGTLYTQ